MKVVLIAPPAAGKGTQAELISKYYQIPKINVGDILRAESQKTTALGLKLAEQLKTGELISDQVVESLLFEKLKNQTGFVLDGYPRNLQQAKKLETLFDELPKIIYIYLDEKTAIERMNQRRVCQKCQQVFSNQKECPDCQQTLSIRLDDNEKVFQKRYEIFVQETLPILDYWHHAIYQISGNQLAEQVFADIKKVLND